MSALAPLLRSLPLQRSRWTLRALEPIHFDNAPGSTLRGALGAVLRRTCCFTGAPACDGCGLRSACAYGSTFEWAPGPGLRLPAADAPRPFVLRPLGDRACVQAGEEWQFDLLLIGRAIETLPLWLWSVAGLEESGLGARRGQGCGRFSLQSVLVHHGPQSAQIPQSAGGPAAHRAFCRASHLQGPAFAPPPRATTFGAWDERRAPPPGDVLRLRWETSVGLLAGGQPLRELRSFADLLRPLLRRATGLWLAHAPHPPGELPDLSEPCGALIEAAASVPVDASRLRWTDGVRYSARQGREVPFGGLSGELALHGAWGHFWPLLVAGEALHLGKNCVMGQGRYRILDPNSP
jgi:hypothetical protein